jgi:predicted transcriptional regulator
VADKDNNVITTAETRLLDTQPYTVEALARALEISKPTAQKHLDKLFRMGLVSRVTVKTAACRTGISLYYTGETTAEAIISAEQEIRLAGRMSRFDPTAKCPQQ